MKEFILIFYEVFFLYFIKGEFDFQCLNDLFRNSFFVNLRFFFDVDSIYVVNNISVCMLCKILFVVVSLK